MQHQVVVNSSGCLGFVLAYLAFKVLGITVKDFQVLALLLPRRKLFVAQIALERYWWWFPSQP